MLSQNRRVTKLNKHETTLFLELYSKEKLLYDPNMNEYHDGISRAAANNRISNKLNIPGFGPKEVVKKIKNLRSYYCQELKKISKGRTSGKDRGGIYKPRIFWFQSMNAFLRPFVLQRKTQSNMIFYYKSTQQKSTQTESKLEIQLPRACKDSEEVPIENIQHSETEMEYHGANKSSEYKSQNASKIHTLENMKKKRTQPYPPLTLENKKNIHDYEISFMTSVIDKLQELSNPTSQITINKDDSFDYFGKYIASTLRDLGQPKAMKLQQGITNKIAKKICLPEYHINDNSNSATSEKQ